MIKGVLTAHDALKAVESGADGIVVSNHGGRQLDCVPATLDVLPSIAAAVGGSVEILLDGGVRRGTDVLKALALGASAVMIGRPYWWGLTVDREDGVIQVLNIIKRELDGAMALSGRPNIASIGPDLLSPS